MLPATPAARHRAVAALFTERVLGVADWGVPAPVAGWTARDVVGHLVGWVPAFLSGTAGLTLASGPDVAVDPVAAWQVTADGVQRLLDDPATARIVPDSPYTGGRALPEVLDSFWTGDVFLHTWDLARATGQDDRLDPDTCAGMLEGMAPMEEMLRSSGQYGPAVPVPQDASAQDRLIGFIGRDPYWRD